MTRVVLGFFAVNAAVTGAPMTVGCGSGTNTELSACITAYRGLEYNVGGKRILFTLPTEWARGETISTRVAFRQTGNGASEADSEFPDLSQYRLQWGDARIPVAPILRLKAPGAAGLSSLCILRPGQAGVPPKQKVGPFSPCHNFVVSEIPLRKDFATQIPEVHMRTAPLRIRGSFSGDLSTTEVRIDKKAVVPLAESEHEILVEPPDTVGLHEVLVKNEDGVQTRKMVRFLELATNPKSFAPESSKVQVQVKISGLDRLEDQWIQLAVTPNQFQKLSVRMEMPRAAVLKSRQFRSRIPFFRRDRMLISISKGFETAEGTYSFEFDLVTKAQNPRLPELPVLNSENRPMHLLAPYLPAAFDYQMHYMEASSGIGKVVSAAIEEWSRDNSVTVERAAQLAILKAFDGSDFKTVLSEQFTDYDAQFNSYRAFLRVFTRLYLYELRKRHHPGSAPAMGKHFQQQGSGAATTIGLKDYLAYPVDQFRRFWVQLTTAKAYVEIDSEPDGMAISFNREPTPRDNNTNGTLELPVRKGVTVYWAGRGGNCRTSEPLRFECPGYKGRLRCMAQERQVDTKELTPEVCPVDPERLKLTVTNASQP